MSKWSVLCAALLLSCADGGDTDTDTDGDTDTDTDTDTDVDGVVMTGLITSADGTPMPARVNMCMDLCYTVFAGDDGRYEFMAPLPRDEYWFYVVPVQSESAHSTTSVPLSLTDYADDAIARDVTLPDVAGWKDLPAMAAPVELAPGLTVTLGADTLVRLDNSFNRTTAATVAPEQLPEITLPDGTWVAGWYLQPLEAKSADGRSVPFEIANTWGGLAGETYLVYTGKYEWTLRATVTLAADGDPITGQDLGDLTSLIVLRANE